MGDGILWLWMTMSLYVVYSTPLFLNIGPDFPPNSLPMKKLSSNNLIVPAQALGFDLRERNKEK